MPETTRALLISTRLFAAFLVASPICANAVDPYQVQNQPQERALRDPERTNRPVTNTLKGDDIKEHLAKINGVKAQIFKQGSAPAGATFRANAKDGETEPKSFTAEARFDQFKPQIQRQVAIQMDKTPAASDRVTIQVDASPDGMTVASAKLAAAPPADAAKAPAAVNPAAVQPAGVTAAMNPPAPVSAGLSPAQVLKPFRAAPPPSRAAPAAPRPESRAVSKPPQGAARTESAPPVTAPPSRALSPSSSPLPIVARMAAVVIVGDRANLPAAAPAESEPFAVIPTPAGRDLTVRARDSGGGTLRVEVSGRSGDLPQALKTQVQSALGAAAMPAKSETPVTVVLEIRADRSIRILESRPENAAPVTRNDAATNAPAALPASIDSNDGSATVPGGVPAPDAAGGIAPPPPAGGAQTVSTPFPALSAAKAIAAWTGIDAGSVRLHAPRDAGSVTLNVPVQEGREIRLEAIRPEERGAAPTVRAEGRFGDFAPPVRAQVQETLGRFNASGLVTPDSTVSIETRPLSQDKVAVTAIAVKLPDSPRAPVVLWRDVAVAQPEKGTTAERPDAVPADTRATVPSANFVNVIDAPAPKSEGLAPALSALVTEAYGLPDGAYEVKTSENRGALRIEPRVEGRAPVTIEWRMPNRQGADFEITGKPVDFTDTIREQVYARLREAIENGETWATDAVKGARQVQVSLVVDPTAEKAEQVRVREVAATMKDAARDAAQAMGLREGDFFVVNMGPQALIVLEQGRTATVKVGRSNMRLTSPDGDAKVFVIPSKTKKDTSAVLMLSRESLRANRGAITAAVGPKAAAAIRAAMDDNAEAGEFILNLNPDSEDPISIRAMSAGASLSDEPAKEKKPEDLVP